MLSGRIICMRKIKATLSSAATETMETETLTLDQDSTDTWLPHAEKLALTILTLLSKTMAGAHVTTHTEIQCLPTHKLTMRIVTTWDGDKVDHGQTPSFLTIFTSKETSTPKMMMNTSLSEKKTNNSLLD